MVGFLAYLYMLWPRALFYRNLCRKNRATKRSLLIFKREIQSSKKYGTSAFEQMNRIAMYITILSMDLTVLRSRLVLERDGYVKNVYARQLAVLVYEFIQDYPNLFGKQFWKMLKKLPNSEEQVRVFKTIGKKICNIKQKHRKMLKEIRVCVAAHRDKDGERQYDIISKLSIDDFSNLTSNLDSITMEIIKGLRRVVKVYSYSPLMIREIANNVERIASAERGTTTDGANIDSKWIGQEFEEGLKLNPFPNELIFPNAKGKKLQITTNGKEKEVILSTMDKLNEVNKYYEQNLPKYGWKKVIEGSYKNSKESSLYFEKGNREALINISPDNDEKTEIIVLWRPANQSR